MLLRQPAGSLWVRLPAVGVRHTCAELQQLPGHNIGVNAHLNEGQVVSLVSAEGLPQRRCQVALCCCTGREQLALAVVAHCLYQSGQSQFWILLYGSSYAWMRTSMA
eukprot:GHRQ01006261.1.p1 GENE.GHRQ01006261.1~~GHRQ01006261.1.p1  ORF type:complete len:107 (-),score=9.10 GHRQ01006261.1:828-1148(-)